MQFWKLRFLGRLGWLRYLARIWFGWIFRDGRVVTIKRGPLAGMKWRCRRGQQFWLPLGCYENETASELVCLLKQGMTFVDVGAHAGYFTLLGKSLVGTGGNVVAFEPNPRSYQALRANLKLNDFACGHVAQIAIYSRNNDLTVLLDDANSHLLASPAPHVTKIEQRYHTAKVRAMTLDCALQGVKPDVIKIDVEGSELEVLKGARGVLELYAPSIILATHSRELKLGCARFLMDFGYECRELEGFEHTLVCEAIP